MGLFQNLLDTYEKCKEASGITKATPDGTGDERKTFLPLYHMTFKSHICITLDFKGRFISATRDGNEMTIIIPCTESSAGRANYVAAHPLCDQIDYVGNISSEKSSNYQKELSAWEEHAYGISKAKLKAILEYVCNGTMLYDLTCNQIFRDSEYNDKTGAIDNEKIRKLGVRFVVEIVSDLNPEVWNDNTLRQSWIDFVQHQSFRANDSMFDYMCGSQVERLANQHPKNINSATGNAKLLSCNDTSGYTYRGRFTSQDDAIIIDFENSQKIHQTLRWLINNHGYNTDSQTIVVWAVDSNTSPPTLPYINTFDMLWSTMDSFSIESDLLAEAEGAVDANYAKKLRNLFQGYGNSSKIKKHAKKICIAIFDAATTGRMGLTFYQELAQDTYLENIVKWHEETSYYMIAWEKERDDKGKEIHKPRKYIGAPSYDDILFAVYGKSRGKNDAGYNTLKRKVRKQLLECMFGNFPLPKSMIDMAAVRASHPMSFDSESDWERTLSITCALARKHYFEEEISLALDETRQDRDYLFGRLLAVADKLEQFTMYKADKQGTRATNAIRYMGAFAIKPYHTWGVIYQQLLPYINQLHGSGYYKSVEYYQSIIDDILVKLADNYEDSSPLTPLYLLGFSAQRRAFWDKKENTEVEKNVIAE